MPEKPEAVPGVNVIEAVRAQVLVHLMQRLTDELRHPLSAELLVFKDGHRILDAEPITQNADGAQVGEIRLRFRRTGSPDRFLFFADSLFAFDERTPAFCGFSVRGDVRTGDTDASANFSTWIVKREDRSWAKWL